MKNPFVTLTHGKDGKPVFVNPNNITYITPNDDDRGKYTFIYFNSEKDHIIPVSESYEDVIVKVKETFEK